MLAVALVLGLGLNPAVGEAAGLNGTEFDAMIRGAAGHPNERARWRGLWAYDNGRHDAAIDQFQLAASYGDKVSQHVLTLMYWHGDGVDADPVKAYIWADLAAERGTDQRLLAIREKLWTSLSPEQRQQTKQLGPGYYERYGDDRTMPRNEAAMRRFAHGRTGSRVGADSSRPHIIAGGSASGPIKANSLNALASGNGGMSAAELYDRERLRPERYWDAEDQVLAELMNEGKVKVGELEPVRKDPQ
ncbi:hypothetical protein ACW7G0_13645 [Lysobacter sp. A286]